MDKGKKLYEEAKILYETKDKDLIQHFKMTLQLLII